MVCGNRYESICLVGWHLVRDAMGKPIVVLLPGNVETKEVKRIWDKRIQAIFLCGRRNR